MYTHAHETHTHTYTRTRRQTRGWRVRKKGGAPTPAASLFFSSLCLSLPFLSLFFCEVGAYSLRFRTLFSLSLIPPFPSAVPPPSPLASAFAAALSSSALLFCEKGWLLERKRGTSRERERETDGERVGNGSEGGRVEAPPPTRVDKTSGGCSERSPVSSRIIRSFTGYQ